MHGINAVFFDAGNTLLHVDYQYIKSLAEEAGCLIEVDDLMRAEYQAKFNLDKILLALPSRSENNTLKWSSRKSAVDYFTTLLTCANVPETHHAQILSKLWEKHKALELWCVPQEGTEDILAEIKRRGYRMGIISNSEGRLDYKLEILGLRHFFEVVIDSGVVGVEKPHRKIFQLGLSALNVKPTESLYVGDIYSIDAVGAMAVGMKAILLDRKGLYTDVECQTIAELSDLLEILRK